VIAVIVTVVVVHKFVAGVTGDSSDNSSRNSGIEKAVIVLD